MRKSKFTWKGFHRDLDIAVVKMLMEKDTGISRTGLIDFLEYSNRKRKEEKRKNEKGKNQKNT